MTTTNGTMTNGMIESVFLILVVGSVLAFGFVFLLYRDKRNKELRRINRPGLGIFVAYMVEVGLYENEFNILSRTQLLGIRASTTEYAIELAKKHMVESWGKQEDNTIRDIRVLPLPGIWQQEVVDGPNSRYTSLSS